MFRGETIPDPADLPKMGPRGMAVVNRVMSGLAAFPVCPHLATGGEHFEFWVSWLPDQLMCAACCDSAQEAAEGSDPDCSYCGRLVGATGMQMALKATDNAGMYFWLCEQCITADLPGVLLDSPSASPPGNQAAAATAEPTIGNPFERDPSQIPISMGTYQLPPEGLVVTLVASVYGSVHLGLPARRCIDACRTLHYAYAQFGIRSELRAVVVTIRYGDGRTGHTPVPSWNGAELAGHAILCLPDAARFVDPTVEQFPGVAGTGPIIGHTMMRVGSAATGADPFPSGENMAIQRGDATLIYTISSDEATRLILDHPNVRAAGQEYRKQGIQIASCFLAGLAQSPLAAQARQAQYPRLTAFLDAINGAEIGHDDGGFWYMIPPAPAHLRFEEIPLPPETASPAPEDLGPDHGTA
jgi:hypothetical protein